ncbi:glycosyl hydrolase family 31 [Mucilaginibacter sp. PPCGB 2223]|uniref:glycoside hydrolase family 31 protein n=1 Tax=Mucilaginibacter sp. PPCGB 2223 TaxID=1886027 RepID=UPI000826EA8F|nr:TIM-barrel domain-containing protein [Mucilaginibacter sp. PPCGB 2223]OCX53007.1 glycosyl hydrolase family 31 [Mucilaginibacter sp. PPCGB 2223]
MNIKRAFFLLITLIPVICFGQVYRNYRLQKDQLSIFLTEGRLDIKPLSAKAVRIRWQKDIQPEPLEFILTQQQPTPPFRFSETQAALQISTTWITVSFDKTTGALIYRNHKGQVFLNESGSRKLTPSTTMGIPSYIAEQSFISPPDEHLFGLGQFQDAEFDLRNVYRKLIQVNTQIALPFLFSSRGYGILWHQYGLTYFNPADNDITLQKKDTNAVQLRDAEVTTTAGTRRVSQQQALYAGKFKVETAGNYTFALDLGDMDNRHLLLIDGIARIDQSNLWLPPAVGKIVYLTAGEHTVQVLCKKSNKPRLSWKLAGNTSSFRSPDARSLDYTVFYGENADEVIASYRQLSGQVPMLPLWAYGFWQCRERYASGDELIAAVKAFRDRKLPLDVIVQDWQYWGKYGWGVPKFDETHYANPEGFIKDIHNLHAHFSLSVWENPDKKSEVAKPYVDKGLYLVNSPWLDMYNPEAQKTHWDVLNANLFSKGVDSWWMDATEPENDALTGKQTYFGAGDFYRLTYPLFVSKAIYEGQRAVNPQKRVTILTRSAFPGQQRYGTINWSGDIGGTWDSFKRQIVAGLNYSITGMPYWTTDIGGFFRPGRSQYTDEKYHDLLTRWFQWGAFNPIFRVHGYQSETEPWKYGEKVEGDMREITNMRYRLLPYIYSEAWQVHHFGSTIMRPLVMDFASDSNAVRQPYEYMFGKAMLIAPVTAPDIQKWTVYLPEGQQWYSYWNGKMFAGGQAVQADAPHDKIPVFVKSGSIIPMAKPMQYTGQKPLDTLEVRIYPGAGGRFDLYEDEGDGYRYEQGKYTIIPFVWNDKLHTLNIGARRGSYQNSLKKRVFNIVLVRPDNGISGAEGKPDKSLVYFNKPVVLKL